MTEMGKAAMQTPAASAGLHQHYHMLSWWLSLLEKLVGMQSPPET